MENTDTTHKNHRLFKFIVGLVAVSGWLLYRRMPQEKRDRIIHMIADRLHRASQSVVEYIIPHERNGYKPRVFQARSVRHIVLIVVMVKVVLVSTLFALYPNLGNLQSDIRSQMYTLINEYRLASGVAALSVNENLEIGAQKKGADMLEQNYFSHYGPDGTKPWQWLDPATFDFKAMGENLAMDFLTSNSVFKAFKASPTHNKNLINGAYQEIGISVQSGTLDNHQTNIMVVFFGTRKDATTRVAVTTPTDTAQATSPTVSTTPQPTTAPSPSTVTVQEPVAQPTTPTVNPEPALPTPTNVVDATMDATVPEPVDTTEIQPVSGPQVGIRKVAEMQPDIEVLGEAISNDNGVITESFGSGVTFSKGTWVQRLVGWVDRFLMAFLLTLVLLLITNIIVKIRVQHAHIIANAVLLIIVVAGALYLQVHAVEAMGEQIRILGVLL